MSNIIVLGGTGYAGSAIVAEAAARGHQVTSVSRSAPATAVDGVSYVHGQVAELIAQVADGADVVVAALAPRGDLENSLIDVYTEAAQAAQAAGARFLVVGGWGSLRPAAGAPRFAEGEMPPEYVHESRTMASFADQLLGSPEQLDWTFVSPAAAFGSHNPGDATGTYRVGTDVALTVDAGDTDISGADFALAIVDEVEAPKHHRAHINIAY